MDREEAARYALRCRKASLEELRAMEEEEGTERDEGGNTSGRFSGENGRGSECSSGKGRGTRNASSEGARGQGATLAGTLIWGGLFALASGAAWAGLFWLCFAGGSCR